MLGRCLETAFGLYKLLFLRQYTYSKICSIGCYLMRQKRKEYLLSRKSYFPPGYSTVTIVINIILKYMIDQSPIKV